MLTWALVETAFIDASANTGCAVMGKLQLQTNLEFPIKTHVKCRNYFIWQLLLSNVLIIFLEHKD